VQLVPGVLHVIDPCTGQTDAIAYVWFGEMAAITSHKLDDQVAVLLRLIGWV
jgi:hypothetical protein